MSFKTSMELEEDNQETEKSESNSSPIDIETYSLTSSSLELFIPYCSASSCVFGKINDKKSIPPYVQICSHCQLKSLDIKSFYLEFVCSKLLLQGILN